MRKGFIIALLSVSLLLWTAGSSSAATDVTVTGNGYRSQNHITLTSLKSKVLTQTNNLMSSVHLKLWGNTGDNEANQNVGGAADITTGAVANVAEVTVTGGDNTAVGDNCGCEEEPVTVEVKDNGAKSHNDVTATESATDIAAQLSQLKSRIWAKLGGDTGHNETNQNVGSGESVTTSDVTNGASVTVSGGSNNL